MYVCMHVCMYVCMYVCGAQWLMVECLTRGRRAAGSSLKSVIALCPRARRINHSFVLVQPRKIQPSDITEKLMTGT